MKKLLLIILLIVGCTTEPEDVSGCMDGKTCEELEIIFENATENAATDINNLSAISVINNLDPCMNNNCPSTNESVANYIFPLQVGNTWTYDYSYTQHLYEDEEHQIIDTDAELNIPDIYGTTFYQLTVSITEQKILFDTQNVYELEFNYVNDNTNRYEYVYINEDESGLYLYGSKGPAPGSEIILFAEWLPRTYNGNNVIINIFFNGYILSHSPRSIECDGNTYIIEKNPLRLLKYPIQLNDMWVKRPLSNPYQEICEANNKSSGYIDNELFSLKKYIDFNDNCVETETYSSMPNIADDIDMLFTKEYCDYGIKSSLYTLKLGAQMVTDEVGNELGIMYPKMEISFQLIDININP